MAITTSGKDKLLRYTRLLVNEFDLSGDSRTFGAVDFTNPEIPRTGWSDTLETYMADRAMLGLNGYQAIMNDAAGQAWSELKTSGQAGLLSMLFGGGGEPAIGDPAYLMAFRQISVPVGMESGGVVLTADFRQDSAQADAYSGAAFGYVLHPVTSLSATTNGDSIDLMGAAGTMDNGAQAHLHITASSGGTWAFKIQDSANDSAWADYLSFTANGSAVTSERQSSANQLDRYVRFVATRTSGTVTAVCTFGPVQPPTFS